MSRPKTKYPIESFGPELMDALRRGGRELICIEFPHIRIAKRFQMRIFQLRGRMREENHPDAGVAMRARVALLWGDKINKPHDPKGDHGAVVEIRPHDSEFREALDRTKRPSKPTSTVPPVETESSSNDDFLLGIDIPE